MQISAEKVSVGLTLTAIAVLLIDKSLVELAGFSLSIGAIEFSGVKISSALPPIIAVSAILSLIVYHFIYVFEALAPVFSDGYAKSTRYQKLVRDEVTKACGNSRYGSPCGGKHHTFRRQTYNFGQFQHDMGHLTDPVIITPSWEVHVNGVLHGLRNCISIRIFLASYAPATLGIWALWTIAL